MSRQHNRTYHLEPREKVVVKDLLEEIRQSITVAQSLGLREKLAMCNQVMHCLWDDQHDDGKKHGPRAVPWDGTIDSRVREAAKVVKDTVKLMMRSIRSGAVTIGPADLDDEMKAQTFDRVLRLFLHRTKREISSAMKLFFTSVQVFGYGILHVDWRERQQLLPHEVDTEGLRAHLYSLNVTQWLEQNPEAAGQLPPEVEAEITQQVAFLVEEMLLSEDKTQLVGALQVMDAKMPASEAMLAAKALSKDGRASYHAPRSAGGRPKLRAILPMVNGVHGMDLSETGEQTWMALPERLTASGLIERAALNGWKADIEELLKHPNQGLSELSLEMQQQWDWLLNGLGVGIALDKERSGEWYEVVTLYRVACNEAGIPAVYETEIFPAMPELEPLSHEVLPIMRDGECLMPFVTMQREPGLLAVCSPGIPQEMLTDQLAMKKIWDGSVAAAELAAYPPTTRWPGDEQRVMPGSTLLLSNKNTGTSGAQSRFVDVPGVNMGALKALQMLKDEVAERYHRGGNADPNLRAAYESDLGEEAVMAYTEVITLIWAFIQAYVTEITASRIANRRVDLKATEEDLMGTADITVDFSATSLSIERSKDLTEFGRTLLQFGSKNVDADAVAETVARTYDAALAERIIRPSQEGAETAAEDERKVIMEMQGGFEVRGRMNAPQSRLQAYEEWMRNPSNIDRCAFDPGLYELCLLRIQGLEMQVEQYTTNVTTGQTGQKPPSYEQAEKFSARFTAAVQQRAQQIQAQRSQGI